MTPLTHAGYFEGIGGFSLGAQWAGLDTIYTCEIDDYRHNWLKHMNPNATHERDIRTATGQYADIFTGGFPCQDISTANSTAKKKGKKTGLEGERSGLWHDFYRIIRLHRPSYIVLENSPNLVNCGLGTILGQLAQVGYDAEWQVISKRGFGFKDIRKRLFVVAYRHKVRRHENRPLFNRIAFENGRKTLIKKEHFFNQFERIDSSEVFDEAIRHALQADARLPRELVKAEIEAYGDAVCPYVAVLIFELIKQHSSSPISRL